MRSFQFLIAVIALLALAACGGGGGGGGFIGSVGGYSTSSLASNLSYASGPSDTTSASLTQAKGVAGVLAMAPGVGAQAGLQSIKVRTSSDYQIAYVSINGGPEMALSATFPSDANGGGYGPTGPSGNYVSLSNLTDYSLLARTEGSAGGFGYAGIAAQPSALPANLTYTGTWTGYVNPNVASVTAAFGVGGGSMSLTLDVASNNMDGTFSGDLNIGSGTSPTSYPISGVVDTTLSGSIFDGTMTANTGSYTGSSAIAGVFFGDDAATAAGAFGGSLTGPTGTHPFYGIFNLN